MSEFPCCCMCGEDKVTKLATCPVSEVEMGEGRGLTHLLTYSWHPNALRVWERTASIRQDFEDRAGIDVRRWVRQEDAEGCSLAVIAMLTGRSYAEARTLADAWDGPRDWATRGTSHLTIDRFLAEDGYAVLRKYGAWNPSSWHPEPFAPIHYASVRQPSRTGHFVVVLGDGTVLDPLREGTYRLTDWSQVNQLVGVWPVLSTSSPDTEGET